MRSIDSRTSAPWQRAEIRSRLWAFYDACATADMPETTRLAGTIETWWPAIEAFLLSKITNARTEGSNRMIKQIKRVACGFRSQHYERPYRPPRRSQTGRVTP